MRIGTDAATVDFHAEVVELICADAALKEGTRIDAGRAMALNEQQVARMLGGGSMPEMVETHVVKCGGRAEGGDMAAQIAGLRSEEHTSELQSLMRISYAVFCLKKKQAKNKHTDSRI